jgi:hypothetical protein
VCLSILELQKEKLLKGDYITCLKISTKPLKLECHKEVVKISERIKKILFDGHLRRHSVLDVNSFPKLLEKEVE